MCVCMKKAEWENGIFQQNRQSKQENSRDAHIFLHVNGKTNDVE